MVKGELDDPKISLHISCKILKTTYCDDSKNSYR